tara:strand:+ start:1319 stop:2077 length:759 start_codon:yes stop_codon:yes gene_type:complete
MTKTVASIQVRMGSTRLPGKVMRELLGKPVLRRLYERVKMATQIDEIVIITSENIIDDVIEEYCFQNKIEVFRGSENNVLYRILSAMEHYNADIGVTLFGDCPCVDPKIIDQMLTIYKDNLGKYDYVGNDLKTTYPPGLEVEIYSINALKDAHKKNVESEVQEHGTLFIRQHPEIYQLLNIEAPKELYFPDLEIELDTEEDFFVIETIFKHFHSIGKENFSAQDIVLFMLENPALQNVNKNVERRWKKFRKD